MPLVSAEVSVQPACVMLTTAGSAGSHTNMWVIQNISIERETTVYIVLAVKAPSRCHVVQNILLLLLYVSLACQWKVLPLLLLFDRLNTRCSNLYLWKSSPSDVTMDMGTLLGPYPTPAAGVDPALWNPLVFVFSKPVQATTKYQD